MNTRQSWYIFTFSRQGLLTTPHTCLILYLLSNDTGSIGIPFSDGYDATYEVPQNVLVEVESDDAGVTLNGSGQILVSVLGLGDPRLIQYRIGDVGALTTDSNGRQTIKLSVEVTLALNFISTPLAAVLFCTNL